MPQATKNPTCNRCKYFSGCVCTLKAAADWGDRSQVKPDRPVCFLAELATS